MRALCIFILSLLAFGCAAESSEVTPEPLTCKPTVIETPDGSRLLVECNRPVEAPIPAECEDMGQGSYLCNTYHADDAFCHKFPHVCDPT